MAAPTQIPRYIRPFASPLRLLYAWASLHTPHKTVGRTRLMRIDKATFPISFTDRVLDGSHYDQRRLTRIVVDNDKGATFLTGTHYE